jgi:snurportin-1
MVTHELYPLLLENFQFFPKNVYLDGINFYYSESLYTPGDTPLVLWLNPFMVPDVLGRQVNDLLAQKPLDYVNIFEHCQNLKKKKRKRKKNRKNPQYKQMEIDDFTEVCRIK